MESQGIYFLAIPQGGFIAQLKDLVFSNNKTQPRHQRRISRRNKSKRPHRPKGRPSRACQMVEIARNMEILTQLLDTPWKINMEHSNHPFRKENDLPNLYDYVPC